MRTQNPSHAVRKNNGSILYKNAFIVGLFTSAAPLPCCSQGFGNKAPALSLPHALSTQPASPSPPRLPVPGVGHPALPLLGW